MHKRIIGPSLSRRNLAPQTTEARIPIDALYAWPVAVVRPMSVLQNELGNAANAAQALFVECSLPVGGLGPNN
tara:strand:- start:12024 stop:12242 length:219 start_codon:yes stop_codon:yes gene_type:complete